MCEANAYMVKDGEETLLMDRSTWWSPKRMERFVWSVFSVTR